MTYITKHKYYLDSTHSQISSIFDSNFKILLSFLDLQNRKPIGTDGQTLDNLKNLIPSYNLQGTGGKEYLSKESNDYFTITSFASSLLQEQEYLSKEFEATFQKRFWDILA